METKELKLLVNKVLDIGVGCGVDIDVWHPHVSEIKDLLNLGHDKIDPNDTQEPITVFKVEFDNYYCTKAPSLRLTLFCKELGAEFMRKHYVKKKGGDIKCR